MTIRMDVEISLKWSVVVTQREWSLFYGVAEQFFVFLRSVELSSPNEIQLALLRLVPVLSREAPRFY